MRPLFIVFEGLDGSGTSTQAKLLVSALNSMGRPSELTSEPSDGPIGKLIRQCFSSDVSLDLEGDEFDYQMGYLFAADRFHHMHNKMDGIKYQIGLGKNVVSTRYYFSSFAYHCPPGGVGSELVARLNRDFPEPDLVIYVDAPVEVSLERLAKRNKLDSYENSEKLKQVQLNYYNFFRSYSNNILKIDGVLPELEIHSRILDHVLSLGGEK